MSSFGPINTSRPRFGECRYCWDENWARRHHTYFESRNHMIGPVCKHRLLPAKNTCKQHQINRTRAERLPEMEGYWERRAWLPDYCGEPGELSDPRLAGLSELDSSSAELIISNTRIRPASV